MTRRVTVFGIVQGVGYRPFVARLAEEMSLTGTIMNCGGIVQITVNTPSEKVFSEFVRRLKDDSPPGSNVLEIRIRELPDKRFEDFRIVPSAGGTDPEDAGEHPLIPADLPLCEECRQEMLDPENRRYLYPFISCVACGPRYSIIKALPYDRDTVTMDIFPMCPACGSEYTANQNRRRHAQTISCHDCGPRLILDYHGKVLQKHAALLKSVVLLQQGNVLAIKGIGGYQFACLPSDPQAVDQLRLLKQRDKKPFAVMFPNLASIRNFCETSAGEEALLLSAARPIVLLDKKKRKDFYDGVCGESLQIGAFLPYTPLHQLLNQACGPLVMTSANRTSDPIIYKDDEMLALESPYLAGVLYNERRITTPLDDSVTRFIPETGETGGRFIWLKPDEPSPCLENPGTSQILRRSRGYVPVPVVIAQDCATPVLAMGGDMKSAFCLYHHQRAYVSQYFGDMENARVSEVYEENLARMQSLFGITPELIVRDLHPRYFTAQLADRGRFIWLKPDEPSPVLLSVQHHHAHAASVMAEHGLSSCIGVVFDGTGYGTDGAVWGGEFLLCREEGFERRAHLGYVTLAGGDAVARSGELAAQCYLIAAETAEVPEAIKPVGSIADLHLLRSAIAHGINTARSSSMGRLFDAVSAILEIRQENTFEGECAIALENAARTFAETGSLTPYGSLHFKTVRSDDPRSEILIDQIGMFRQIAERAEAIAAFETGPLHMAHLTGAVAYAFHMAIAEMIAQVCTDLRAESGENTVVLSGGVFANRLLLQSAMTRLQEAGFDVFINSQVPANDGGICLGQAWIAGRTIARKGTSPFTC